MKNKSLGDRMKEYENISRIYLTRRMPLIMRIDGKAFHSFTKGFDRPFDTIFMNSMKYIAIKLCESIQGCKLAYIQSDEISLLITDYDDISTQAWFEKNLQKMVSVSASIATLAFNKRFTAEVNNKYQSSFINNDKYQKYSNKFYTAMFDSRAFILPREEVVNYFIWRQQDATRNAILSIGAANFSVKELYKKKCNDIQEMLIQEKGINFNNYPIDQKRGSCCIKETYNIETNKGNAIRNRWIIDESIPIFTADKNYITKFVDPICVKFEIN